MDTMETGASLAMSQFMHADNAIAVQKLKAAQDSKKFSEIEESAKEFEAVFLAEMIKPMFEGISTEAPFGGGKGEEIFRGMMIQEYSKKLTNTGGIGIADHVRQELIKAQEFSSERVNNEG